MRIHITGASGAGTTTLAQALATELSLRHLDADSYYWRPSSPPFKNNREAVQRLNLLNGDLFSPPGAVLSGSIVGWGKEIEDAFDLVVFLYLPADLRITRLRQRETERYGTADPEFLKWAAQYDEGPSEGRSLAKHEAWLAERTCPVLRLAKDQTTDERLSVVRQALPNPSFNRSANGRSPVPVCGEVHSPQPGPGGLPSSPG